MKKQKRDSPAKRQVIAFDVWENQHHKQQADPLTNPDNSQLIWGRPEQGEWSTSRWHAWTTLCGRYRVYRIVSLYDDSGEKFGACINREGSAKDSWDSVESSKQGPGYPKYFRTLLAAMESCEQAHTLKHRVMSLKSNMIAILAYASNSGLEGGSAGQMASKPIQTREKRTQAPFRPSETTLQSPVELLPSDSRPNTHTEETSTMSEKTALEVKRDAAISLFQELNFQGAEKWNNEKFAAKISALPKAVTEEDNPESKACKVLFKSIMEHLKEGGKVVVVDSEEAEAKPAKKQKFVDASPAGELAMPAKKATKPESNGKVAKAEANGKVAKAEANGVHKTEKLTKEKPASKRVKVMGSYSVGPFCRWLGRIGVNFDNAKRMLEKMKVCTLSDPSIKWELKEVREKCPPAEVSKEDEKTLRRDFAFAFAKDSLKPQRREKVSK